MKSCARASRTIAAAPAASASTKPKKPRSGSPTYLLAFRRHRARHAGRLAAPRPRNRRRSRSAGHRPGLRSPASSDAAVEYVAAYPGIHNMIAKGENKVSFYLANSLQVDVRLLPSESLRRGAAILHRLQGAQRLAAPARAQDGLHAERVGAGAARRQLDRGRGHRRRDLRRARHGLDAARDAREPGRDRGCRAPPAAPPHRASDIAATCTCTPPPPTAATPSARWPKPRSPTATSTSPSPTTRRTWP